MPGQEMRGLPFCLGEMFTQMYTQLARRDGNADHENICRVCVARNIAVFADWTSVQQFQGLHPDAPSIMSCHVISYRIQGTSWNCFPSNKQTQTNTRKRQHETTIVTMMFEEMTPQQIGI